MKYFSIEERTLEGSKTQFNEARKKSSGVAMKWCWFKGGPMDCYTMYIRIKEGV